MPKRTQAGGKGDNSLQINRYLPFEEARAFVQALGLKNQAEWRAFCRSEQLPPRIPAHPDKAYWSEFKSLGDWLGTGSIANRYKGHRSFEEARAFVQALGLKNQAEWKAYYKSGQKPSDIPSNPNRTYKGEFLGFGDWLGTGTKATQERKYLSFEEARAYVQSLGLKTGDEWKRYSHSDQRPAAIPTAPRHVYATQFISMEDWLGTKSGHSVKGRMFLPFEEARKFVQSLGLKSHEDWLAYCMSAERNLSVPANPWTFYASEFTGMRDWLGITPIAYLPYEEALAFVHALGFQTADEWKRYSRSGKKPEGIPANPRGAYPERFTHMGEWLGNGRIPTVCRTYLPFEEARQFVRSLHLTNDEEWKTYCRTKDKPERIPANPRAVYRSQYKGTADWLGVINKWNRGVLLSFLQDIRPRLHLLEERELYIILQELGALPALRFVLGRVSPMRVLQDLLENDGKRIEQVLQATGRQENDEGDAPGSQKSAEACEYHYAEEVLTVCEPEDIQALLTVSSGERVQANAERIPPPLLTRESLHVIDLLSRSEFGVNEGVAKMMIANRVSALWERYISEGREESMSLLAGEGGPFFTYVKAQFLAELAEVEQLVVPAEWSFSVDGVRTLPNVMQRRIAWLVRQQCCVGNWSGAGAGKTLSAILGARMRDARVTLVVTNNATVENWQKQILNAFPDSFVQTTIDAPLLPQAQENSFLVLHYEHFQGRNRNSLVQRIATLALDMVVLDEAQFVKQRDTRASQRRLALEKVIVGASAKNPELRVLAMSATPVINNLLEARKLLEIVTRHSFQELDVKATVNNALAMHHALMRFGIRYRPRYEQEMQQHIVPSVRNDLWKALQMAQTHVLQIEQTLLQAKLEAIRSFIHKGTLIYTYYVNGMVEPICQFLGEQGFSIGLYTGGEKSGVKEFLSGRADVLIGSSAVGVGLDGLQSRCDRIIVLSPPWTGAAYEQLIGRVRRQGSRFERVDIVIPQIVLENGGEKWSWDERRWSLIHYKRTLSDCTVDGTIPETVRIGERALLDKGREALDQWIARVGNRL